MEAASEGLWCKVRMSGLQKVAGAEKLGTMAANLAKLDKTTQAGLCTKIRAMGEMGARARSWRPEGRPGQRRGTRVSGTRWLPELGPWRKM